MNKWYIKLFFICGAFATFVDSKNILSSARKAKHIKGISTSNKIQRARNNYSFCKVNGLTGACLHNAECDLQGGQVMGFCNKQNYVCCNVVKTCDEETSSHKVTFRSPSFPKNDTESRTCSLALHIGSDICAVRMENEVFELSTYYKDLCPVNTLIILGTKTPVSALCGNMTGWSTTFEVEPYSKITLAMILQHDPPYRFSTLLNMLPCNHIQLLQSPINAGIRNVDAERYIPTPVPKSTEAPTTAPSVDESTTEAPTTTPSDDESTTITNGRLVTTIEPQTNNTAITTPTIQTSSFTPVRRHDDASDANGRRTPLPTGVISPKTTPASVITEERSDLYTLDGTDSFDPTPDSVFKKIFNARSGEGCRKYDNVEEENVFEVPHPKIIARSNLIDNCWQYDPEKGSYKINEDCPIDSEEKIFEPSYRVIGGRLTNINEYPWQVGLTYKDKFFCGGALISDRYVLTASHCLFGSFSSGIHLLKVILGDHDLRTKNETENMTLGVKRVIWNLHYGAIGTDNDIGLLELSEPVEFSYRILPVNLPTDLSNSYAGQNVTITGWGRNSLKSKKTSPILKEYTAPVDDIDNCVRRWKLYPKVSAKKPMHICLNVTYGTPCHGDSGGPLVSCSESSKCTIIGVVSFGFPLCRNVGLPAVFTRVTTYKRWIDINTSPLHYDNIY